MIVSHRHRFIFLKTRKTAGTSLEIALSKYCGPEDILTSINYDEAARTEHSARRAQNHEMPLSSFGAGDSLRWITRRRRPARFTEHMTGVEIRERLGAEIWNSYFKFTIVRNPFDRMVSRYHWTMKMRPRYRETLGVADLARFIRYRADFVNENWLIYTAGDELLTDDVVRYEHLAEDLGRISASIGLPHNLHDDMKAINAKGSYRPKVAPCESLIGPDEEAIIGLLCRKEIEACRYSRPATV